MGWTRPGSARPRPDGSRPAQATLPVRLAVPAMAVVLLGLAACTSSGGTPSSTGPLPGPTSGSSGSGSATPSRSPGSPTANPTAVPTSSTGAPGTPPAATCDALVGKLTLAERVGQLLMVSASSTKLSSSRAAMIGRTHAGSVLLLGNSKAGLTATQGVVADIRAAADRPQRINVVVAADQEGGLVQRLAGTSFTDMPSAVRQAQLTDSELTREAEVWGDELDKAGINLNLAPVADVVPRSLAPFNQPIAQLRRGYGSSPTVVARKVAAFTTGMDNAGVATAVKHFPGLGQVRGNTDTQARVVDSLTARKDPLLSGFQAAVDAQVDMVMVSSATYTKIDAKQQAAFSPTVITGMIRGDLGFDGVVISDDLAAKGVSDVSGAQRAVRFVQAGGDLIIVSDPTLAETMAKALVAKAKSDPAFAALVDQSAARVLAFKDRRDLAPC